MAALKYRDPVSGAWVALPAIQGGQDEVAVAHRPAPAAADLELWVDLDGDPLAQWPYPRGQLAYAEITADFTGTSTSIRDVTGLWVTFTVPAGRRIKVSASATLQKNSGDLTSWCILTINGDDGRTQDSVSSVAASSWVHMSPYTVFTSVARTYIYKVQLQTGAGFVNINASGARRALILVEDIGS